MCDIQIFCEERWDDLVKFSPDAQAQGYVCACTLCTKFMLYIQYVHLCFLCFVGQFKKLSRAVTMYVFGGMYLLCIACNHICS